MYFLFLRYVSMVDKKISIYLYIYLDSFSFTNMLVSGANYPLIFCLFFFPFVLLPRQDRGFLSMSETILTMGRGKICVLTFFRFPFILNNQNFLPFGYFPSLILTRLFMLRQSNKLIPVKLTNRTRPVTGGTRSSLSSSRPV